MRLVTRVLKNSHNITIKTLEELAAATGVSAWQLLLDDFDPQKQNEPPPLTDADRALMEKIARFMQGQEGKDKA